MFVLSTAVYLNEVPTMQNTSFEYTGISSDKQTPQALSILQQNVLPFD